MTKNRNEIVLYILVRDDIPSMTVGKMFAQVSHITADVFLQTLREDLGRNMQAIADWAKGDRVGNTVVLQTSGDMIHEYLDNDMIPDDLCNDPNIFDVCYFHDSGYTLDDGVDTHKVKKFTGAWVLARRRAGNKLFSGIGLADESVSWAE